CGGGDGAGGEAGADVGDGGRGGYGCDLAWESDGGARDCGYHAWEGRGDNGGGDGVSYDVRDDVGLGLVVGLGTDVGLSSDVCLGPDLGLVGGCDDGGHHAWLIVVTTPGSVMVVTSPAMVVVCVTGGRVMIWV
ncbi:hypothetical protein V498_04790, partial [Pseudogymnoascus sp. VKM F-4517 (FW-2822)]